MRCRNRSAAPVCDGFVCCLQTPAPYEGVLYYIDHACTKFGAPKLQLDATVRFVLSPCGLAATNPSVKSQGMLLISDCACNEPQHSVFACSD